MIRCLMQWMGVLWLAIAMPMAVSAQTDNEVRDSVNEAAEADSAAVHVVFTDSVALPFPQNKQAHLARLLNRKMFDTSQVGIMVYDLTADSAIFCHNERQLMRPASTMKLITAITAIDQLGGSHQFKTQLCYTGTIAQRTLQGNVYCVGGFDPLFNGDDMNAFAASLRRLGVDTIRGNLYADESMKTAEQYGEGWCWDDENPVLSPLLIGGKARFMERFTDELRKAGVVLEVVVGTAVKPQDAICIESRFHTMDQVLMKAMKDSNNLFAESLFYQLAATAKKRPASAKDARSVIKRLVTKLKKDPSHYRFADGSGLSLYNYVTPELEIAFLKYAYRNSNIYLHLAPSLPSAGIDGTLKHRMKGVFTRGNVAAKTGTLTGISSLAGYCTAANGHVLCFCIINQGLIHGIHGRNFQDAVCQELCTP